MWEETIVPLMLVLCHQFTADDKDNNGKISNRGGARMGDGGGGTERNLNSGSNENKGVLPTRQRHSVAEVQTRGSGSLK